MIRAKIAAAALLSLSFVALSVHADPPLERIPDPEGSLPRYMTPAEAAYVARNPIVAATGLQGAPEGPLRTAAEFEPVQAIMMSYRGSGGWKDILDAMAAQITTVGNADVWVMAASQAVVNEINQFMGQAGADLSRVKTFIVNTDTIWIRDYAPMWTFEGDVRVMVDHTYNRPRPFDNALATNFQSFRPQPRYLLPLIHGGGNYHNDAEGEAMTTLLIVNENPGLTQQDVFSLWHDYQGVETTFFAPLPESVDLTQHIDMWMQPIGEKSIIISTWPAQSTSIQAAITNNAANYYESLGWSVYRTPARALNGTHYTYTNSVICNDIVLIPSYTNGTIAPYNAQAMAVWQSAMPDHQIIAIPSQAIVTAAGVLHCITKHVPMPIGGTAPTAYLRTLRGGETLEPGESVMIAWSSDDDNGVVSADLDLSLDGGATWSVNIASGIADSGGYLWTVPDLPTNNGRVRVTVRDGDDETGFDASESDFVIVGEALVGDLNGDGVVDFSDLLVLLSVWGGCADCNDCPADLNSDCVVDFGDLLVLLANWTAAP